MENKKRQAETGTKSSYKKTCITCFTNLSHLTIELTKPFSVANFQTLFPFNRKIYGQLDGVGKGFPLGPVQANLILGHHENI